jgi:nucleoside phosphorylase/CheY-like chemotaxis protein
MKTLIVEDDQTKLQKISRAMSEVTGFNPDDITHVSDVNSAKLQLKTTTFDLLVLDISLPQRPDQEADSDAGLNLLEELFDRAGYKIPPHILGITGYPEILARASERFSRRTLAVVYFDPTSEEWSVRLKGYVQHIIAAQNDRLAQVEEYRSHLAVVCALESPELDSILRIGWSWNQHHVPNDHTIYYRVVIEGNGESKVIHAAAASRMGMPAAAILSMKMITAFRPRYLGIVGIAAGIQGKTRFGDIVVADPSWDWGSGKLVKDEEGKIGFEPSPHQLSLTPNLRSKFKLLAGDVTALQAIKRSWPAECPEHELSVRTGPLASGASVLADGTTTERIKQQHRQLIGIEMETYGVFAAAEESTEPRPEAFSMKSVVDFADVQKDDRFQKYAAFTSAQALKYFVEKFL